MVPTTWQKIFTSCRNQQAKSCNIPSLLLYDHCHIVPELSGTMPSISLTCLRRKDLQDDNLIQSVFQQKTLGNTFSGHSRMPHYRTWPQNAIISAHWELQVLT
jgi:hypothetical protein